MKTLEEVAAKIKEVTLSYIKTGYTGWKKPPYLTGNLYRSVDSFNIPQRTVFSQKGKSFIQINYAPPNAKYGVYVEKGTYKMPARPFAYQASNSDEVRAAIKEYQDSVVEQISTNVKNRVITVFAPLKNSKK